MVVYGREGALRSRNRTAVTKVGEVFTRETIGKRGAELGKGLLVVALEVCPNLGEITLGWRNLIVGQTSTRVIS